MELSDIWQRIQSLGPKIAIAQNVVLTVAGLSGLLAFWQFAAEREAREIDRAASFVSALATCAELPSSLKNTDITFDVKTGMPVGLVVEDRWFLEAQYACDFIERVNYERLFE